MDKNEMIAYATKAIAIQRHCAQFASTQDELSAIQATIQRWQQFLRDFAQEGSHDE